MEREATIRRGVPNERSRKPAGYWLIVGREDPSRTLVLYSGLRGEILPAFGSEEDAGVFLILLRTMGGGLELRYMAVEGLVSLLSGPLSNIELVALDPAPEMDADAMLELISLDRESFLRPR